MLCQFYSEPVEVNKKESAASPVETEKVETDEKARKEDVKAATSDKPTMAAPDQTTPKETTPKKENDEVINTWIIKMYKRKKKCVSTFESLNFMKEKRNVF